MDGRSLSTWVEPFQGIALDLLQVAPRLAAAIMLLCAGMLLAFLVRAASGRLLAAAGLDRRLGEVWLFRLWSRSHPGRPPSQGLANVLFYSLLFVTLLAAFRALGLGQGVVGSLLSVLPRVLSVMLILFLGALLASFLSLLAQMVLAGSGVAHSVFWAKVTAWATFGVALMFSLEPLGLAGQFITQALLVVLAAAMFGAALAFGMGCKDLAREFMIELLREDKTPQD